MAKETKKAEQTEAEKLAEQQRREKQEREQRFNRRVNYFVMRRMWQVVRGRSSTDTIYSAFGTSRERYTRIIDTGTVRYSPGELAGLQQVTGLRREIFTGEARFKCPHQKGQTVEDITEAEWRALFEWRENRKGKGKQEGEDKQEKIYAALKEVSRTNIDNNDFYRLCYFLRERRPAPVRLPSTKVRDAVSAINGLTFDVLDNCEAGQLGALQKLLKAKLALVNGIGFYKDARDKAMRAKENEAVTKKEK